MISVVGKNKTGIEDSRVKELLFYTEQSTKGCSEKASWAGTGGQCQRSKYLAGERRLSGRGSWCKGPGWAYTCRNIAVQACVATVRPVRREVRHGVMDARSGTALWTM